MKKILILNLSCDDAPYDKMIETSLNTWDSIEVPNCETIYYCGRGKQSTDNIIRLNIKDSLRNMGEKTIMAFAWALANKEFDYIARVHSSCYVDKKRLIEYVQTLPTDNLFSGVQVNPSIGSEKWMLGGGHTIASRDVIKKIVENKDSWNHSLMEDMAMSFVVNKLEISYHNGKSCSLNETENGWLLIGYGGESLEFSNFEDIKKLKNHFYRVKIDRDRSVDEFLMNTLFKTLQ